MANRLIICDLDGTIVDSRTDITDAVNSVRAYYGLTSLGFDTVTSYIGNGSRVLMERSLQETDIEIEEAFTIMQDYYRDNFIKKTTIYPGTVEGLKLLTSNGFKMAIATNKPQKPTELLLNAISLSRYFDVILGGSEDYDLKPDPAMLKMALERTASDPGQSWMIGDNYTDLESARRAGVKNCFAKYGFGEQRKESYDIEVDSFAEFAEKVIV